MARVTLTCCSRAAIPLCSSVCLRRDLCSIFTLETAVSFHYSCADKLNKSSYVGAEGVVPPVEVQPISSSSPLIWCPWPPAPSSSSLLARPTTFSPHTIPVWSKKTHQEHSHTDTELIFILPAICTPLLDLHMNGADRSLRLRMKPWFTDCWVALPLAAFWPPPARRTCPRTSSAVSRAAVAALRPAASVTPAQSECSSSEKQREMLTPPEFSGRNVWHWSWSNNEGFRPESFHLFPLHSQVLLGFADLIFLAFQVFLHPQQQLLIVALHLSVLIWWTASCCCTTGQETHE